MKARRVQQAGFTLVKIMIAVLVIAMLGIIAIPAFAQARNRSAQHQCISNLRSIEKAKARWDMDNFKGPDVRPQDKDLFGPKSYVWTKPQCPSGGQYELNKIKERPTCTVAGHTLN
jgi:Tfp pilus assembly protein PilE